jgi:hypothetical protein
MFQRTGLTYSGRAIWNNEVINIVQECNPSKLNTVSEKTDKSYLGPWCSCCYFPEDTSYAVPFKALVPINYWHLIKNITNFLEQISPFLRVPSEGILFLELQCSFSPDTDLWRTQRRGTHMQTHIHTDRDNIPRTTFT